VTETEKLAKEQEREGQESGGNGTAEFLPTIDIAELQLREKVSQALEAIEMANRYDPHPRILQQGGVLVRLRSSDEGHLKVDALTADALRGELARVADWQRSSAKGPTAIDPPMVIARDILTLGSWKLPQLRRVATAPYFTRSQRLVVTPGYDPTEGVILRLPVGLVIPAVSESPTAKDLERATDRLLNDMLGDFPFESTSDVANAIAALLYPFVRDLIDAPPPLHVIDAPTPGTGKGLLAHVLVRVPTGAPPAVISEKGDNDELRKTITALLMDGASTVLLDNVRRRVGQSSLAALLTADLWCDRILGVSRTVTLPNRTLWLVTGNNTTMSDEMVRRTVRIRLDARLEDPSTRTNFRHDPLVLWIDERRGELLWGVLTLASNWLARGAKPFTDVNLGSFERWTQVMGGILRDAGIAGFLDTEHRNRARREADPESMAWGSFFAAWWKTHEDRPVKAGALIELAGETIPNVLGSGLPKSQETRLGTQLARRRGRVFAGFRLENAEVIDSEYRSRSAWKLDRVESPQATRSTSGGYGGYGETAQQNNESPTPPVRPVPSTPAKKVEADDLDEARGVLADLRESGANPHVVAGSLVFRGDRVINSVGLKAHKYSALIVELLAGEAPGSRDLDAELDAVLKDAP
jgi:hypothetical protein